MRTCSICNNNLAANLKEIVSIAEGNLYTLQFWLLDAAEKRGDVSSENSEEYLTKPLRESKLIMGFEIA